MPQALADKPPSLVAGITIVAGTAVGAGMFSLPVVSAGMWFSWSILLLAFTWFFMYHSSLMIMEVNLNYEPGASFDTFVRDTLGPRWNLLNSLTLTFVLYILTYAYVSGGGSIVSHTLSSVTGLHLPGKLAGLIFAVGLAAFVWFSTALVGRMTTILVGGMIITFALTASGLTARVQLPILLDNRPEYALFTLAAIPYFLTSFGYHGNVPSLIKYYGRDPRRVRLCLLYGSLISLLVYSAWHVVTLGNISRPDFKPIIAAGGNIGDLVAALAGVADEENLTSLLSAFANMAVVSSFLGVSLGLFDFIADKFKFDDSRGGRFKTALLTFVPPTLGGLIFPNGFLYAIALAGLCACMWGAIIPALAVKASRKKYGNPHYRVWGGDALVYLIMSYGGLLIVCYFLAAIEILPVY
ncbi:MAG TPA: tryptophan permease [Gammaproteobacteria bacterium]|nr:tryptophan permease [Gammaproteobacteria bacterium]HAT25863.1 tryptophan permease [Gammaproteobacteria bacterium]